MSGAPTWARSAKRYGLSHRLHNAGAESIPRRVSGCPTRVPPGSVEPVVMYLDAIMLTMHVPYTLAEKRHCAGEVTSHDKIMLRHDHLRHANEKPKKERYWMMKATLSRMITSVI